MVSKIHGAIIVKRPAGAWSTTLSLRLAHGGLLSCLLSWMLFLDWPDNGIYVSSVHFDLCWWVSISPEVVEFLSIILGVYSLAKESRFAFTCSIQSLLFSFSCVSKLAKGKGLKTPSLALRGFESRRSYQMPCCLSGRKNSPGERVYQKIPEVQILYMAFLYRIGMCLSG